MDRTAHEHYSTIFARVCSHFSFKLSTIVLELYLMQSRSRYYARKVEYSRRKNVPGMVYMKYFSSVISQSSRYYQEHYGKGLPFRALPMKTHAPSELQMYPIEPKPKPTSLWQTLTRVALRTRTSPLALSPWLGPALTSPSTFESFRTGSIVTISWSALARTTELAMPSRRT